VSLSRLGYRLATRGYYELRGVEGYLLLFGVRVKYIYVRVCAVFDVEF
jgi:hypothetical protein